MIQMLLILSYAPSVFSGALCLVGYLVLLVCFISEHPIPTVTPLDGSAFCVSVCLSRNIKLCASIMST